MSEDTKHISISDYNYPLPDERISKFPLTERDHSKLLLYKHGDVSEDIFYNLPKYLPKGALMVFNNTKVHTCLNDFRIIENHQRTLRQIFRKIIKNVLRYITMLIKQ